MWERATKKETQQIGGAKPINHFSYSHILLFFFLHFSLFFFSIYTARFAFRSSSTLCRCVRSWCCCCYRCFALMSFCLLFTRMNLQRTKRWITFICSYSRGMCEWDRWNERSKRWKKHSEILPYKKEYIRDTNENLSVCLWVVKIPKIVCVYECCPVLSTHCTMLQYMHAENA